MALAVSAFGIGTSEYVIMGLLPELARSFNVTIPKAGFLVSGYALSVTFLSPLIALALSHLDRKKTLLILMAMFLVGNGLCAIAPTYTLFLIARILTALCHGAFFGAGSIVAMDIVAPERKTQAVALMFSGLTLANVLGVPAGTALGNAFGWRSAFLALIPIGLIAGIGLSKLVPPQPAHGMHFKRELRAVITPGVQTVLSLSTLTSVALFCVFTYIAPILEQVTGLSAHAVTLVLVVFGIGITVGINVGGKLGDWRQVPSLIGGIVVMIGVLLVLPFAFRHVWPAVIMTAVWGFVHFAATAGLQARIVQQAAGAPNLASTLNQGAFNLGNALGASLGGGMIAHGFGYDTLPYAAATVALLPLALAFLSLRMDRRAAALVEA